MTEESKDDQLFFAFPNIIKALQWHSYEVVGLENNNDITLLASSAITKYQIFKYKKNAYGIQFHIEIKNNTVDDWGCVPEYKKALDAFASRTRRFGRTDDQLKEAKNGD